MTRALRQKAVTAAQRRTADSWRFAVIKGVNLIVQYPVADQARFFGPNHVFSD